MWNIAGAVVRGIVRPVMVWGLVLAGAATAGAQQTCRPVTTESLNSVTRFLNLVDDVPWLRAHGITATDASTLVPLDAATSPSTCARLDSAFDIGPITAFRAGAYIIATNSPVAPDPVTGKNRFTEVSHVRVFDSVGVFVYLPGTGLGPPAPLDLEIAEATPEQVRIAWRNQSSRAVSNRVQRAVGTGSFGDVGPVLAVTDTSFTDASVTSGASYRYRVASIAADGSRGPSEEVTVTLTDIGPVTRPATGLLFRDTFDRADGVPGASWVVESGTWAIASNAMQITIPSGGNAVLRLTGLAARKDFNVQVVTTRTQIGNYAATYLRRVGTTLYLADLGSNTEQYRRPRMYRQTNGGYALLGYGTFTSTANANHRLNYSVFGSDHKLWADGTLQVSAVDATPANDIAGNLSLNVYGSGGVGTVRYDDLIVTSSRAVTMAGLPNGHRIRVNGLLSSIATGGAPVSVDLLGTKLPASRVEILNANNVIVKTFGPSDGVWGGDRYSLNSVPCRAVSPISNPASTTAASARACPSRRRWRCTAPG